MPGRCIFCRIVAGELPASVVHRGERFWAFLDIHPIRPGHVLVIPTRHAAHLDGVDPETAERIWQLGREISAALRASDLPCEACHFVLNDGRAAWQTVPHAHLHVIPRSRRDSARATINLVRNLLGAVLPYRESRRRRSVLDAQAEEIRRSLRDDVIVPSTD